MTKWWSVLPLIFLGAFLQISQPDIVKSLSYVYYDYLHSTVEEVDVEDIVLVNIDEKEYKRRVSIPGQEI